MALTLKKGLLNTPKAGSIAFGFDESGNPVKKDETGKNVVISTETIISLIAGEKPELDDLVDGQIFVNLADTRRYQRFGDYIIDMSFLILPNFEVTNYSPEQVNEQTTNNVIDVYGSGFSPDMTVNLIEPTITIENVILNYVDDSHIQIFFDAPDDILYSQTTEIAFSLTKGFFTSNNWIVIIVQADDLRPTVTEQNPNPLLNNSTQTITLTGTNFNTVSSLTSLNFWLVINSWNIISDTEIEITASLSYDLGQPNDKFTSTILITNQEGELYYELQCKDLRAAVTSQSPDPVPDTTSQTFTLYGINFASVINVYPVQLSEMSNISFNVISDTELSVTADLNHGATGIILVKIENSYGFSKYSLNVIEV